LVYHNINCVLNIYTSDFQLGFRGTQGFREHMPRVPRLVSKKTKKIT